ncbi:hypothetical protein F7R25_03925 [Burkholderia stagnalis]|uniref:Uncharacterized protein n=1 Tax=Burkholderia stagnalis TaxID=1503054 RepID=A0A6L3N2Z6_9BURK|nr:hypothetical protein [Burkholderia stagnalis]KAB0640653.1 hypothetical protein F7R25_03925 [Burkholderia stagnalis]VWB06035.1 hypothetical protein BST28156_00098 [Burkholderia stagnalis]
MNNFINELKEFLDKPKNVYYALYLIFFLGLGTLKVNEYLGDVIIRIDFTLLAIYYIFTLIIDDIKSKQTKAKELELEQEINSNQEFQFFKNKTVSSDNK